MSRLLVFSSYVCLWSQSTSGTFHLNKGIHIPLVQAPVTETSDACQLPACGLWSCQIPASQTAGMSGLQSIGCHAPPAGSVLLSMNVQGAPAVGTGINIMFAHLMAGIPASPSECTGLWCQDASSRLCGL